MALSNAEKQKRFYERKVKTGGVKRYEFRLAGENNQVIKYLADHWGCSLTAAFERCVMEIWEKEGKPIPTQKRTQKSKKGSSYTDNQSKTKRKPSSIKTKRAK